MIYLELICLAICSQLQDDNSRKLFSSFRSLKPIKPEVILGLKWLQIFKWLMFTFTVFHSSHSADILSEMRERTKRTNDWSKVILLPVCKKNKIYVTKELV